MTNLNNFDDSWWFIHITVGSSRLPILLRSTRGGASSVNLMNYDARFLLRPISTDFIEGILETSFYQIDPLIGKVYVAAALTVFDAWGFRLGLET